MHRTREETEQHSTNKRRTLVHDSKAHSGVLLETMRALDAQVEANHRCGMVDRHHYTNHGM